tara:strand:- start:656 stop:1039 length:384 start_codon:yes stop_codon:yes gene_type:complete
MNALSLAGKVVFNHVTKPDVYEGVEKYSLTVALDKDSAKLAELSGLKTNEYKGIKQITCKRKIDFGAPKVYNKDKDEVGVNHLSLFGDDIVMKVKPGKGKWNAFAYLEAVRVEEKAAGVEDIDQSDF